MTGKFDDESHALRRALERMEPLRLAAGDIANELYVEILLESCDRFRTRGEYASARERIIQAEDVLAALPGPASGSRFDAMFESWTLGGMGAEFESPSTQRLGRYGTLLEMSKLTRSFTSPRRTTRIARGLMQYSAESGDREGASEWAQRALRIAKRHSGPRVFAQVALDVADWLITTERWPEVPRLLRAVDSVLTKGHPDWIALQAIWAYYSLRTRKYRDAGARAAASERAADGMKNARYKAATWTTMALAAHALGQRNEARDRVNAALKVLESRGTPWTCKNAYQAAATITGEKRYRCRADDIRQQLQLQFQQTERVDSSVGDVARFDEFAEAL